MIEIVLKSVLCAGVMAVLLECAKRDNVTITALILMFPTANGLAYLLIGEQSGGGVLTRAVNTTMIVWPALFVFLVVLWLGASRMRMHWAFISALAAWFAVAAIASQFVS